MKNPHAPNKSSLNKFSLLKKVEQKVQKIEIIENALFLLKTLEAVGGKTKLTQTGNTNRVFLRAFVESQIKDEFFKRYPPSNQADCLELTRIRFLLTVAGYLKENKNNLLLSSKGSNFLKSPIFSELYRNLIEVATFEWEWGYGDRYDDFHFIQETSLGFISYLVDSPTNKIKASEIYKVFFEKQWGPIQNENNDHSMAAFLSTGNQICRCLETRFLKRFCVPFGLLESDAQSYRRSFNEEFKKTDFTLNYFEQFLDFGER